MKTKELIFSEKFIPLIKNGTKNITIRNTPRELGIYKVSDDIEIEVYGCVKVSTGVFSEHKFISFNSSDIQNLTTHKDYKRMGFKNGEDTFDYYNEYLDRGIAFVIFYNQTIGSQMNEIGF